MAKVYIFRDPVGRIGQLQLEPEQMSRLREHLQRDQREDVFEVRRGQ